MARFSRGNKNKLRTFQSQKRKKIKYGQPETKFTDSYKKKECIYKKIDLDSLLKKTHKCCVTNSSGNYNAESKLKTLRLPQNREKEAGGQFLLPGSTFVTLKTLLFVKKEIKDNLKDFLKDFHFLKDNLQP